MIGKGLDFPGVTLVGVLNADTALSLPDFRSSERTFQLITQVAGRCGRASPGSRVIVQSYVPEDPAVAWACEHDYNHFSEQELRYRKQYLAPPYQRWARLILRDKKLQKLEGAAQKLRADIDEAKQRLGLNLRIRGPFPAALARLENYFRWQILLQAETAEPVQNLLFELRRGVLANIGVLVAVDVDPVNLL